MIRLSSIFALLAFVFIGLSNCQAQNRIAGDSLYSGFLLIEDLKFLKDKVLETHQSPFTYTSEAEFNGIFDTAALLSARGLNFFEFARLVSQSLKVMKDSHSYLDYQGLLKPYNNAGGLYLPFTIYTIDNELYVVKDELNILKPSSRILSINGVDAERCATVINQYAVREGNSDTGELRIRDAIFNALLPTYVPIDTLNRICLVSLNSSDITCLNYPGKTRAQIKSRRKLEEKQSEEPRFVRKHGAVYELELVDSLGLAILKVGSFSYHSQKVYDRFLKRSFKTIKKQGYRELVIDLRNNTGGKSSRAELLLSYLAPGKVNLPANIIARQSPIAQERYRENSNRVNRFFLRTFHRKDEEVSNYLRMMDLPLGATDTVYYRKPHPTEKWAYDGQMYLWINGTSASASVNVAAIFKREGLGLVMGEACLGPETGTWGNPAAMTLPNTGLKINLSTIRFNADNSFRIIQDPVKPDLEINWSPERLENEDDPFLEAITKIIQNH